jgi:Xaa-Pro dipeptidase
MPNQERLERMRRAMSAHRIDALIVRLPENVLLLSGFWPMIGAMVFVFPVDGVPDAIFPDCYEQEAGRSLWEARATHYRYGVLGAEAADAALLKILSGIAKTRPWKRVGFEDRFDVAAPSWNAAEFLVPAAQNRELLREVFPNSELVDISSLIQVERRTKTPYEMEKLRVASEISSIGLDTFDHTVDVGLSGVELAAAVEGKIMSAGTGYRGAFRVRAFAQVAVGAEETAVGYRPNEVSTVRRLQSGDVALVELGVVVDGFWADRTRVRVAGQPTDEQKKVFEIVRMAQEAAIKEIRPGAKASRVDEAARSVICDAGYQDYFPHITGHGLGFRYHESSPILSPSSLETLEEGMLTSVEPGIYKQSVGGFRIEDDVFVVKSGAEILGAHPKILI